VVLIGKLAVDKSCQGQGIGQALMRDAFLRVFEIAKNIGIYAIRIDPSNQTKQGYYIQKFGFIPFDETLSVFLPITTIREALR
jgi:predicted N-acetyltransferase YhbS